MRSKAITKNAPTPTATNIMSTLLGIVGTCEAKTVKSGSATVINTPIKNAVIINKSSLREDVSLEPNRSPIVIIDISAPTVNKPIPRMRNTEANKKRTKVSGGIGATVKLSSKTMPVIGSTDVSASFNLSIRRSLRFLSAWARFDNFSSRIKSFDKRIKISILDNVQSVKTALHSAMPRYCAKRYKRKRNKN